MNLSKCIALCAVSIFASASVASADDTKDKGVAHYESGAKGEKDAKYSILHITTKSGEKVDYYFNKGDALDACLTKLGEKQPNKSLAIKWHNYKFVTGDLKDKTYRQSDTCHWVAEKHDK